jgi:hypothetical protein
MAADVAGWLDIGNSSAKGQGGGKGRRDFMGDGVDLQAEFGNGGRLPEFTPAERPQDEEGTIE